MFDGAKSFNQPLSNWDVSLVTNMQSLFSGAEIFNQPLNTWDVSNVKDMSSMFQGAKLFNQPLYNWNVSSVYSMFYMFFDAYSFDQPLGSWDVNQVFFMWNMLANTHLSTSNYDNLLNGWVKLHLQVNVNFSAGKVKYSHQGAAAHKYIVNTFRWNIVDGGINEPPTSTSEFHGSISFQPSFLVGIITLIGYVSTNIGKNKSK